MPKVSVELPVQIKSAIDQRIASGEYTRADEYVSDLVRRDQQRRKRRELEQLLLDRLDRRDAVELTSADFKRLRRRLLKSGASST